MAEPRRHSVEGIYVRYSPKDADVVKPVRTQSSERLANLISLPTG